MKINFFNLKLVEEEMENSTASIFTLNRKDVHERKMTWTTMKRFYPKSTPNQYRLNKFLKATKKYGITCPVMMDQPALVKVDKETKEVKRTGRKIVVHRLTTEELSRFFESGLAKAEHSIWNVLKKYSALFMTKETHDEIQEKYNEDVSLVYPLADCAGIRFHCDNPDFIGIAHSDLVHTTNGLIYACSSYIKKRFKVDPSTVKVFVSPFAQEGLVYDKIPDWAQKKDKKGKVIVDEDGIPVVNEIWMNYMNVEKKEVVDDAGNNSYSIRASVDYGRKIYDQLLGAGFIRENIYMSCYNTFEDEDYYSNSRSYASRNAGITTDTEGRNLAGICYKKAKKPQIKARVA